MKPTDNTVPLFPAIRPEDRNIRLLSVRDLSKFYGKKMVLHGIEFDLAPGEVLNIVGRKGSGKSTLLQCIAGCIPSTNGAIRFNTSEGQVNLFRTDEITLKKIVRSQIGYVQCNAHRQLSMKITAGGNIAQGLLTMGMRHLGTIRHMARQWLELFGLDPARMDEMTDSYSGGMLKRLQVAAVLASNPRLLLLDDPFTELDTSSKSCIIKVLKKEVAHRQLSVIMVNRTRKTARLFSHNISAIIKGRFIHWTDVK